MKQEVINAVLRASVAEHLVAFHALSGDTGDDITRARKALREWIGTQQETTFRHIDDIGVLLVLLEEFTHFAIFLGEEIHKENEANQVNIVSRAGNA